MTLTLEKEIAAARKKVVTDGYDMSIGEIVSLYEKDEFVINPNFQRYFRWDISQKTKFIESLLLGIPIPPIFVFQDSSGIWELVDGLQRVSTILEFIGILKDSHNKLVKPSVLDGTTLLPSLASRTWSGSKTALPKSAQLELKRARLRIEILKRESDSTAKYELFQRLNTGGSALTPQEVRKCTMIWVNEDFAKWIERLSNYSAFRGTIDITEFADKSQFPEELSLRFLAHRLVGYTGGQDVHEYLDNALLALAQDSSLNYANEEKIFKSTFQLLFDVLGANAFKRWDGQRFGGKFLLSVFEVLSTATALKIEKLRELSAPNRKAYLLKKAKQLWRDPTFKKNSGAGIRGTTRLTNLLPLASTFFSDVEDKD